MRENATMRWIAGEEYARAIDGDDPKRYKILVRNWARRMLMANASPNTVFIVAYHDNLPIGYATLVLPLFDASQGFKVRMVQLWHVLNDVLERRLGYYPDPVFNSRGWSFATLHQQYHHDTTLTEQDMVVQSFDQLSEAEYPVSHMSQITQVNVSPRYQRRGVGSKLVKTALSLVPSSVEFKTKFKSAFGPHKVFLWASPPGKRLYKRLGFSTSSEYTNGLSSVCMEYVK